MLTSENIRMEDVNSLTAKCIDTILFEIQLSDQQQDELWEDVNRALEEFFNYPDYRNYN